MVVLQIIAKSTAMSLFYAGFCVAGFHLFCSTVSHGVLKIHVLLSVSCIICDSKCIELRTAKITQDSARSRPILVLEIFKQLTGGT